MRKKTVIATIGAATLGLAATTTLIAQGMPSEAPGRVDPTRITGGTYQADAAHSMVGWRIDHLGFNDYFGIFGDVEGTLELDPADPGQATVEVTIPVASVTVPSAGLREHLLRPGKDGGDPDFFGPEPAPARFASTAVKVSPGGMTAEVTGDLTLNGVTKPVTLETRFTGAGTAPQTEYETVGFEGRTTIRRSDFGLGFGVPMVGDDVELEFSVAFEKRDTQ
ncbi:YceI family protein [Pelagerythrobacter marensis]|uniref:YceI family protein n=1 Tax=Pelagerythrobacter marensis TaxID=543877 RepID=A0ABZ2D975_9SPHN